MKESTSGPEFLRRSALAALWTGALVGIAIAWRFGWPAGSGFVAALLWSLANFLVLALVLQALIVPGGRNLGRAAVLLVLKLFGLYGVAIFLLWKRWFPLWAFALGIGWPLLVVLLRSLSGLWWGKSRNAP